MRHRDVQKDNGNGTNHCNTPYHRFMHFGKIRTKSLLRRGNKVLDNFYS